MNQLLRLSKVLDELDHLSFSIIQSAVPLMKDLTEDDSELIEQFLDTYPETSRISALKALETASVNLISDAETVQAEIGSFIVYSDTSFSVNDEVCPFLGQVWNGDIYDITGVKGLEALKDDLTRQSKNITADGLIRAAALSSTNSTVNLTAR